MPYVQKWSNDAEIRKLIGEVEPMSSTDVQKFYKELRRDKDRLWFSIVLKNGKQIIGEAGLLRMFKLWNCTDMTIIIGEKNSQGKGYGTEPVVSSSNTPSSDWVSTESQSVLLVSIKERSDFGKAWASRRRVSRETVTTAPTNTAVS